MFSMYKIYGGEDVILPTLYVDEVGTWYTWENIKIHADQNIAQNRSAMVFDGINDKITSNENTGLSGDAVFSMCAWINAAALNDVAVFMGATSPAYSAAALYVDATGAVGCGFAGAKNALTAAGVIALDTWYHIAITKAAGPINTTTHVYVNGVDTALVSPDTGTPNIVNSALLVGIFGTVVPWSGQIFDVRLFNRELSATEIAQIYQQQTITNGLLIWWVGTGNADADWQDFSGNNNHGTVSGTPSEITNLEQESLVLSTVQADALFQVGTAQLAFPLMGSPFISPKTGTLKLRVSQALSAGIHVYSFMTEVPKLTMAGGCLAGMGRYASQDALRYPLPTSVQVQVLGTVQPFTYTVPFVTT